MSAPSATDPSTLPAKLIAYLVAVATCGSVVLGASLGSLLSETLPIGWGLISALAVVAGAFALQMPGVPVYLSISDTFHITSCLLFGPAPATVVIAVDSLWMSVRRGNPRHQILFNVSSGALSLWAGGQAFFWLAGTRPLYYSAEPPGATLLFLIMSLAAVYFVVNSGLVATAVALQRRGSVFTIWRRNFAVVGLSHLAAASASFVLLVLMKTVAAAALAAVVPLLVIFQLAMRSWVGRLDDASKHVAKVTQLYLSTVSALSTAIEAKDGVTSDHVHRVREYAVGLARALELKDEAILQAIEAAALLHDTGKLAIPEHILNKPGKLTPAEFETMKSHVDIGADILSSIDFPYPVIPIVRAHHENWDGTGYPAGLSGEAIPIGARILSVVDCFDALTSDRPYRRAMTVDEADRILIERRGTMYDPVVVDTFLRVRSHIPVAVPSPQLQKALGRILETRGGPVTPTPESVVAGGDAGPLLGLVSLAKVVSQPPTLEDVGTLIWQQLQQVMPGTSMAVFVVNASRLGIEARFAAGEARARLAGLSMSLGERMSGWAAATGRYVLNSDAALDLLDAADDQLCFGLAIPLSHDGVVVGVLTLYGREAFGEQQSRVLEMLAPHLATLVISGVRGEAAQAAAVGVVATPPRLRASGLRVVTR